MTTPTEDEARAEAFKRYDGDRIIDENTGEEVTHDDWGYADTARQAFLAGVEWVASRVSTPPSERRVQQAQWEDQLRREAPTLTQYNGEDDAM